MSKDHQSAEAERPRKPSASDGAKKRYRAPELVVYGDVAQLTAGGVSGLADHGSNMMLV